MPFDGNLVRSTTLRWTMAIAGGFTVVAVILFGFIYWQTAVHERDAIDAALRHEARRLRMVPAASLADALDGWIAADVHATRYGGLFAPDGRRLAGNLLAEPTGLPADLVPHPTVFAGIDRDVDADVPETARALSWRGADGRLTVVGNDLDELDDLRLSILRALGLALVPALALSLLIGAVLARRGQARIAAIHQAIGTIMQGRLDERLPARGTTDTLDRLACAVNAMLDQIQALLEDVRGIGDSMAHDLRTPLSRVRTRLERGREELHTPAELRDCMGRAITAVDQALAVVSAVLRIGQVQHGDRRSQFRPLDLAALAREAVELYEPLAEEGGVGLLLDAAATAAITGDHDLLLEAVGNLLENALRFAPAGSEVAVRLRRAGGRVMLRIEDRGPGIPAQDRDRVLRRFYRGERSRTADGNGLGLSLVAAVAELHGFDLVIGDAEPGCIVDLVCPPAGALGATADPA